MDDNNDDEIKILQTAASSKLANRQQPHERVAGASIGRVVIAPCRQAKDP